MKVIFLNDLKMILSQSLKSRNVRSVEEEKSEGSWVTSSPHSSRIMDGSCGRCLCAAFPSNVLPQGKEFDCHIKRV